MKYTTLPNTDIKISKICLGTMTWGNQNTEAEGHQQLDYALEKGINFIDVAELYPVPATADTYGETEKIIGTWLKKTGNRDNIVLASKIAGPGPYTTHIRKDGFSKRGITEAIENSLDRLQTDYLDLFQLHWPERGVNCFGVRDYPHKTTAKEAENHQEILETLQDFIKQGKIRHIGLSNETPWGTMKYLQTSEEKNLPRMSTIQNSYSLIHRSYEYGLSEISLRENIGLLAYSPLAFGVLTGKYLHQQPKNARVTLFPTFNRYSSSQSENAVKEYLKIAQKHRMTLTELSLAFVTQQSFVTSNIIGATTMNQLKENINSINIHLSDEILEEIDVVHSLMPNPAP